MHDCPGVPSSPAATTRRHVGLDSDAQLQPITRSISLDPRGASAIVPADGAKYPHLGVDCRPDADTVHVSPPGEALEEGVDRWVVHRTVLSRAVAGVGLVSNRVPTPAPWRSAHSSPANTPSSPHWITPVAVWEYASLPSALQRAQGDARLHHVPKWWSAGNRHRSCPGSPSAHPDRTARAEVPT
jgi:hypothetical protein